jgi:hypothetical protein
MNAAIVSETGRRITYVIISPPYLSLWPLHTGIEAVSLKPKEKPMNQGKCTLWTKINISRET